VGRKEGALIDAGAAAAAVRRGNGRAERVGGGKGGSSLNRVSRHHNLFGSEVKNRVSGGWADRNGVSPSPTSCPFHLMQSSTCKIPLSRQCWSRMQSRMVEGGRGEGNGRMSDLPSRREWRVVLGTRKNRYRMNFFVFFYAPTP
jgi:hypothetical protein